MTISLSPDHARAQARRQLRRVMSLLAILDIGVLVLVLGLAVAWSRFDLPTTAFVGLMLVGVSAILLARVALGIRLKRRSGNL